MATADPKALTIKGRLSFPRFTHASAVDFNQKYSNFKAAPEDISSSFSVLLEQDQLNKLIAHIRDVFLPYAKQQAANGEKKDALDAKAISKIEAFLDGGDWADQPPYMPIKPLNPKYAGDTPECVAVLEVKGPKGADITLKARVENEQQLAVPDPDILAFPVIQPLHKTVFEMYPGCYVAATLNLYAYFNNNGNFGIGAGAGTAVYMGNLEGERLGGGSGLNEDDIFED